MPDLLQQNLYWISPLGGFLLGAGTTIFGAYLPLNNRLLLVEKDHKHHVEGSKSLQKAIEDLKAEVSEAKQTSAALGARIDQMEDMGEHLRRVSEAQAKMNVTFDFMSSNFKQFAEFIAEVQRERYRAQAGRS